MVLFFDNFLVFLHESEIGNTLIGTDLITAFDTITGLCDNSISLSGYSYDKHVRNFFSRIHTFGAKSTESLSDIPTVNMLGSEQKSDPLSELVKSAGMHYNR